jgi:hypothetical protein
MRLLDRLRRTMAIDTFLFEDAAGNEDVGVDADHGGDVVHVDLRPARSNAPTLRCGGRRSRRIRHVA